jgi:hypothetical protein
MARCLYLLRRLVRDTRAQDDVEYAVYVGLVVVTAALLLPAIASAVRTTVLRTEAVLEQAAKDVPDCSNPVPGQFKGRSPCAPN